MLLNSAAYCLFRTRAFGKRLIGLIGHECFTTSRSLPASTTVNRCLCEGFPAAISAVQRAASEKALCISNINMSHVAIKSGALLVTKSGFLFLRSRFKYRILWIQLQKTFGLLLRHF